MADIPFDTIAGIAPAEVGEVELYHPKSWWTRYVFSQDAKVIAIQYSITALSIGMVALVLSWLMRLQLGVPGHVLFYRSEPISSVYHHARHDHGDLSSHRAVSGRFWKLPHPTDGRRPGYGFPLCQHVELLGLPARSRGAGLDLFRAWRAHRRRLDAVPAPGDSLRHPRAGLGHHSHAGLPDPVHHRLHHGRAELRGDGAAGAQTRHDVDAYALDGVGHFHGHRHGAAG